MTIVEQYGRLEDEVKEMDDMNLRGCDGFETLLTGSVPDLGFDCAACFKRDALCGELDTNGWVLILWQLVLNVSAEEMRFSHARVTHENHYKQEVIISQQTKIFSFFL